MHRRLPIDPHSLNLPPLIYPPDRIRFNFSVKRCDATFGTRARTFLGRKHKTAHISGCEGWSNTRPRTALGVQPASIDKPGSGVNCNDITRLQDITEEICVTIVIMGQRTSAGAAWGIGTRLTQPIPNDQEADSNIDGVMEWAAMRGKI